MDEPTMSAAPTQPGPAKESAAMSYRLAEPGDTGEVFQGLDAGCRSLCALDLAMPSEEILVCGVFVEVVRGQHDRDDGYFGVELHPQDGGDDRFGDELVAVDATVDDEAGGNDCGISSALGQELGLQGDFQAAGNLED